MTDKCAICLDELLCDLGVAVPCGHCFHRECFACLKADVASRCPEQVRVVPHCPICKRKVKKFHKVFLTVSQCPTAISADREKAERSVVEVRRENLRLHKRLRELKTLSNDQSDLLFRILPRYDQIEARYSQIKREKREVQKQLDAVEDENWELLFDCFEARSKLAHAEEGKRSLEEKLLEADSENSDLHAIWDSLEEQIAQSVLNKRRAKLELKQLLQERCVELDTVKHEMNLIKTEKQMLIGELKRFRGEVSKLHKKLKGRSKRTKQSRRAVYVQS